MHDPIPWLILFLPLLAAVVITLFLQRNARLSAAVSVGAVLASFLLSVGMLIVFLHQPTSDESLNWLQVGSLHIEF